MRKRKKTTVITGVSREQANQAFGTFALATAQIDAINANIDEQCAAIRDEHTAQLTQLTAEKEQCFEVLKAFATENKAQLFAAKKSLDMPHGVIGFRTGTPKLKTLKGYTWAAALQLVKQLLPSYVRLSEEIAKDKLLADRNTQLLQSMLQQCGMQVVQDETFYVDPATTATQQ